MTNDGNHSYTYDAENRIIQVDSGSTANYVYNENGLRARKSTGSGYTEYYYGADGSVQNDYNGTWLAQYVYAGGKLIAEYANNTTHFIHSDHLGSTRLATAINKSVSDNMDYLPYGLQIAGASGTTHKFTGKERDSESGLDMFGARYYGSSLGRFMTPDWAAKPTAVPYAHYGNPQSLNLYSYVQNNPTTTGDPDGHCPPCGEELLEDLALEYPEAAEAVVGAVEEVVGEGTAVAESEGPAGAGSARWGLLAGPALFIGEMINPHTTVGGDKPQTQPEMSKGGKQNKLDSGFIHLTNDEVNAIAKDKNDPRQRRAQTEQKARGIRNKQKRDKQPAPAPPKPPTPPPPTDPPPPPDPPKDPPKQQ
jgi:RHS repeat-associated protein